MSNEINANSFLSGNYRPMRRMTAAEFEALQGETQPEADDADKGDKEDE